MKPITLHPASVLAGLALAAVLSVLAGAAQSHGTATSIPIHDVRLVGEVPAEWWTYVELRSNPPQEYTVPLDHYLVVTSALTGGNQLFADGQNINAKLAALSNGTRVPILPGTLLTVSSPVNLWGYLEPVR